MNSDYILSEERQISINRLSMITTEMLLISKKSQDDISTLFIPDTTDLFISYVSEVFNQVILSKK